MIALICVYTLCLFVNHACIYPEDILKGSLMAKNSPAENNNDSIIFLQYTVNSWYPTTTLLNLFICHNLPVHIYVIGNS